MLEPYDGKLSSTVLMGAKSGNSLGLPGPINSAYRNFGNDDKELEGVVGLFKGIMQSTFKIETGVTKYPVERGIITGIFSTP